MFNIYGENICLHCGMDIESSEWEGNHQPTTHWICKTLFARFHMINHYNRNLYIGERAKKGGR